MVVVYTGRGWLIAAIAAGSLLLSALITGLYYHDSQFYVRHGWPKTAGCVFAALFVWWLYTRRPDETLRGATIESRQQPVFSSRDTLFYIHARHWPLILLLLGGLMYFVKD